MANVRGRDPAYQFALRRACEMVRDGATHRAAADECGVSHGAVYNALNNPNDPLVLLEQECAGLISKAYERLPKNPHIRLKFPARVIFLDDLHCPFTDYGVVRQVVEREGGADLLVTHELLNFDGFARFDQTYLSNPDAEELAGVELLSYLSENFGAVVCGTSNHVRRPIKAILRALRPEQQEYVRDRLRTTFDAIRNSKIKQVDSPILQVGDAAMGHYDRALITPGATPERLRARLGSHGDMFGLSTTFRAIMTGHTHRVTQTPMRGGLGYLYEVGCSTYAPPYSLDHARGGAWTGYRMACGYGRAVFDSKGKIDLTESRAVHLGWIRLPPC